MMELSCSSGFQQKYQPLDKDNQLICGYGHTAVVTGWTVKTSVAKHLSLKEFAVIGNLYSPTRGITPLIRNLLANPHVRFLVLLNATKEDKNAGAVDCLLDFCRQGFKSGKTDTGRECWVINSSTTGYIEKEIPSRVLEDLRKVLVFKEVKSIAETIETVKLYAQKPVSAWGQPLYFPTVEITPKLLLGPRYGHRIEGKTIAETWVKILQRIKTTGTIRPTSYGQWQELIDLMAIVTEEPLDFYFPNPNYLPVERQFIQDYISQMLDDAPPQEGVKYTYGQRLRSWFGEDQLQQLITKLSSDTNSSRAVMSLWDVNDNQDANPPCLNHIWVRIIEQEISLTATFRSNDMFSAWVANAMGLRALQNYICEQISRNTRTNLKLGPLITVSQSAHIYSDCWEHTEKVIAEQYPKISNNRTFDDPSGSFLVYLKDDQIFVEQITPGNGEIVNCYVAKSARKLYQEIAADCPHLQGEHALYLGTELQKAEIALNYHLNYQQDKPLSLDILTSRHDGDS